MAHHSFPAHVTTGLLVNVSGDSKGCHTLGVWYNYYCFNEEQYVCKRLNGSSTTTVQTTSPGIEKVCPTGFVGSDKVNKCYAVVGLGNQPKYSWYDAVTFCTKMSSEFKVLLASINSAQEQDLVSSLTSKLTVDVWIGLINDQRLGTTFKWLDGSNVAYTRWSSGYPQRIPFYPGDTWTRNTWTGKLPMSKIFREHSFRKHAFRHPILPTCVEIISGQSSASWRNTECSDRNAYLCQTPALSRIRSVTEGEPIRQTSHCQQPIRQTITEHSRKCRLSSLISVTVDLFTGHDSDQISSTNAGLTSMADQSTTTSIESVNVFSLIPKDSVSFTSMADHFSDQSTTTSVGSVEVSSFMPKDSVNFTSKADLFSDQSVTDHAINQSLTTRSGSVNVTFISSKSSVSDTSLTMTETALIVMGILVLVGGISAAVVVILVRRKRRRAQIPIQQLSYQGGFHNVLYSAIHDVEI
ncbi:hypothetical protein Btru_061223 [Bulinus truncatus]|nr:hypothetical protein Btru_061223 [Bulinus truncatus]